MAQPQTHQRVGTKDGQHVGPSDVALEESMLMAVRNNNNHEIQICLVHINKNLRESKNADQKAIYREIMNKSKALARHLQHKKLVQMFDRMPSSMFASKMRQQHKDASKLVVQSDILSAIQKKNMGVLQTRLHKLPTKLQQETLDKGLALACQNGHLPIVKLLLKKGADIHADQDAAVEWAAREGRISVLEHLVEKHDADVQGRDNAPLIAAIAGTHQKSGQLKTVRYLVEQGADVQAQDNLALLLAVEHQEDAIATFLLEQGADLDQAFVQGQRRFGKRDDNEGLAKKFTQWWPIDQKTQATLFDTYFDSKTPLKELRQVFDTETGLTGLGLAIKAGRFPEVLQNLRETGQKISAQDIRKAGGTGLDGLKMLESRGQATDLFQAQLWAHKPEAMRDMFNDLSKNTQKEIDLKALFAEAKKISLRLFVRQNIKNRPPKPE